MSVVLNDKPRQSTLKWRWPLSRELTLSVATWRCCWPSGGRSRRCS